MFLEWDYLERGYDYNCLSCGHVESIARAEPARDKKPAGTVAAGTRKIRDLSLARIQSNAPLKSPTASAGLFSLKAIKLIRPGKLFPVG